MNTTKRIITTSITAIALGLISQPLVHAGYGNKHDSNKAMHSEKHSSAQVVRINDAHLEHLSTASKVIGMDVYDQKGEKIGDIKDLTLTRNFVAEKDMKDKKASRLGEATQQPFALISVGGILGLGDDVVRVPLSSLRMDHKNERLVLQGSDKKVVEGIAKQEPIEYNKSDYEDGWEDATMRAKRIYDEDMSEETAIQKSLSMNREIEAFASDVEVTREGNEIILSGTVKTRLQKQRVEDLAKKSTKLDVRNEIRVQK